jgi:gas vesicle protein
MRQRRMEYFVIGIVTGGALGLVCGLLLAPRSGAESRRRLAVSARKVALIARDVADRAEDAAEILGERMDHYLGREEDVAWRKIREIREGVERYTSAQVL